MLSSWGSSWGSSWALSWARSAPPPPPEMYGGWPDQKTDERKYAPDWMVQRAEAYRKSPKPAPPSDRERAIAGEVTETRHALRLSQEAEERRQLAAALKGLTAELKRLAAVRRERDRLEIGRAVADMKRRAREDAFFMLLAH